jgi:hypothetical protein
MQAHYPPLARRDGFLKFAFPVAIRRGGANYLPCWFFMIGSWQQRIMHEGDQSEKCLQNFSNGRPNEWYVW